MTKVSTIYRGYEIEYSDNNEEWFCHDLTDSYGVSYPKLSTVKAKIDNMISALRKKSTVEAFGLIGGPGGKPVMTPCIVTEYIGEGKESKYDRGPLFPKVAAMAIRKGKERPSRREIGLSSIMPNTPEALAAFEIAMDAYLAAMAASNRYKEAFDAIPRLQLEHIQPLVDIYNAQQEPETKE